MPIHLVDVKIKRRMTIFTIANKFHRIIKTMLCEKCPNSGK